MTVSALRKKLSVFIENASDDKIKAMYSMVENDIADIDNHGYSEEFKRELDRRKTAYSANRAKSVSARESKKRINAILNSAK